MGPWLLRYLLSLFSGCLFWKPATVVGAQDFWEYLHSSTCCEQVFLVLLLGLPLIFLMFRAVQPSLGSHIFLTFSSIFRARETCLAVQKIKKINSTRKMDETMQLCLSGLSYPHLRTKTEWNIICLFKNNNF